VKTVAAGRRQPIRQDGEGLPARLTDSAPHPDAFVPVIVSEPEPSPVPNDRVISANGTLPRQEVQRDHPESPLSSACGSAIKRITAGVKAAADRPCQSFDLRPAFTLPASQSRTKTEYCFPASAATPHSEYWPVFRRDVRMCRFSAFSHPVSIASFGSLLQAWEPVSGHQKT
jgi:hypothetical protein